MMDDSTEKTPQPTRPFVPGSWKYDALREAGAAAALPAPAPHAAKQDTPPEDYIRTFNLTIAAYIKKGGNMEPTDNNTVILDNRFLTDLVFKPDYSGMRLTPVLTQLLLAHIGEILATMQNGTDVNMEEQKQQEDASCK